MTRRKLPQDLGPRGCSGETLRPGAWPGRGSHRGRSLPDRHWDRQPPASSRMSVPADRARPQRYPGGCRGGASGHPPAQVGAQPAVHAILQMGVQGAGCSSQGPRGQRARAQAQGGCEVRGWRGQSAGEQAWQQVMHRDPVQGWGSADTRPGRLALGPLPDHVPVVGDDRALQLHHRGEDPLHLQQEGRR